MKEKRNNFGMPTVDNTPIGIIGMEGNFYRGMSENIKAKPLWVRIFSIAFALIAFITPAIVFLVICVYMAGADIGFNWKTILGVILVLCFELLFLGAGLSIIFANLKK